MALEKVEADGIGVKAEVGVFVAVEVRGVLDPVESLLLTVFVLIAV
ncbi:MAG: hypothetical protein KAU58_05485 [Candidatus Omnitrophica bacterium]|nr:hypothetical protein [Candidatus Omnitrophota bacterium]